MNKPIDLKAIEKRAYMKYHQDGVWDIFLGLIMLAMGLMMIEVLNITWYTVLVAVACIFMTVAKKLVTFPRIGFVKFGRERKKKKINTIVVLSISFIFGMVMFFGMMYFGDSLRESKVLLPLIIALWPVIVFSAMAWFLDHPRLYLYGLLFGAMFSYPFHRSTAFVFVSGTLATLYGVWLLGSFMKNHPLPSSEEANDAS